MSYKMNFWRFFYYMYPYFHSSCCSGEAFHPVVSTTHSCMRDVKWSLWDANGFCVVGGWDVLQFCTFALHIPGMSAVAAAASYRRPHQINDQQMSRSIPQPLQLISREKRRKQCLWNFLNIFTKTCFVTTPNSSFNSAWIAVQECETLVTVRNQLSRIFDTEHGGYFVPPCTNV